jgi:hypothetical protein
LTACQRDAEGGKYAVALAGWTRHTSNLPNNAASGPAKARETEVLWCNF